MILWRSSHSYKDSNEEARACCPVVIEVGFSSFTYCFLPVKMLESHRQKDSDTMSWELSLKDLWHDWIKCWAKQQKGSWHRFHHLSVDYITHKPVLRGVCQGSRIVFRWGKMSLQYLQYCLNPSSILCSFYLHICQVNLWLTVWCLSVLGAYSWPHYGRQSHWAEIKQQTTSARNLEQIEGREQNSPLPYLIPPFFTPFFCAG